MADYRELIGEIDAAIVATPTNTHHTIGVELLSSGIPLFIEKPLATNAAAADELVNLARKQGLVLQVGHVERFNPALAWVASEVRDPKYIEATRTSGYSFRSTDIGVVLDVMIHDLDIVLALANSTVDGRAGAGHFGARRARGHGHRPADVCQRLRGPVDGLARELPAAADDEHLHVARVGVDRFRVAGGDARQAARGRAATQVSGRPADRPRNGRI